MSDLNKAVLQKANAAVRAGDNEGFLSCCSDDIVWTTVGGETLRGKQAVRRWMATAYREPPRFSVHQLIGDGDFLAALGDIDGTDDDGQAVSNAYCDVWRFDSGKMAALNAYVIPLPGKDAGP